MAALDDLEELVRALDSPAARATTAALDAAGADLGGSYFLECLVRAALLMDAVAAPGATQEIRELEWAPQDALLRTQSALLDDPPPPGPLEREAFARFVWGRLLGRLDEARERKAELEELWKWRKLGTHATEGRALLPWSIMGPLASLVALAVGTRDGETPAVPGVDLMHGAEGVGEETWEWLAAHCPTGSHGQDKRLFEVARPVAELLARGGAPIMAGSRGLLRLVIRRSRGSGNLKTPARRALGALAKDDALRPALLEDSVLEVLCDDKAMGPEQVWAVKLLLDVPEAASKELYARGVGKRIGPLMPQMPPATKKQKGETIGETLLKRIEHPRNVDMAAECAAALGA